MTTRTLNATHAYLGFNAAGEARAIVFDDPGCENDTARTVARWISEGRTVQRMPLEQAKALLRGPKPQGAS